MTPILITIKVEQFIEKSLIPPYKLEDFNLNFCDPEPYLITDSLCELKAVEVEKESVLDVNSWEDVSCFWRSFKFSIELAVSHVDSLVHFLEEDGVLYEGILDADAFARHFVGDWEGIFIEDLELRLNNKVSGALSFE